MIRELKRLRLLFGSFKAGCQSGGIVPQGNDKKLIGSLVPAGNYKHPPIEEAICDFTFAFPEGHDNSKLDLALPGKLQSHANLEKEYTGEVRSQNVQSIIANAAQASVSVQNALTRIQLTTPDARRIVSIGAVNLGVSVLKPYDGWNNFRVRTERALGAYWEIARPSKLTRLGLRYINRIVVPQPSAVAANYMTNLIASSQEATLVGFMYRSEYALKDNAKVLITQATLQPATPGTSEFLLDIDVFSDSISVTDGNDMMDLTDRLHEMSGNIFESSVTEKSRELFDAP